MGSRLLPACCEFAAISFCDVLRCLHFRSPLLEDSQNSTVVSTLERLPHLFYLPVRRVPRNQFFHERLVRLQMFHLSMRGFEPAVDLLTFPTAAVHWRHESFPPSSVPVVRSDCDRCCGERAVAIDSSCAETPLPIPWTATQITQPSQLAAKLSKGVKPVILQVGFQVLYKSKHIQAPSMPAQPPRRRDWTRSSKPSARCRKTQTSTSTAAAAR